MNLILMPKPSIKIWERCILKAQKLWLKWVGCSGRTAVIIKESERSVADDWIYY